MRIKERMKKGFSVLLALNMVLSSVPLPVFAAEGCTHHTVHTAECGYAAAVEGAPCTHSHDTAVCGYVEAVEEVLCACTETDESGALVHTEGCSYVAPVTGADSTHSHDASCGYVEAVEGKACTFECETCTAEEADATAVAEVKTITTEEQNALLLSVEEKTGVSIHIGGVELFDGEYLANGSTEASVAPPESGGYAYFKDGTLTLSNYIYEGTGYIHAYNNSNESNSIFADGNLTIKLVGNNVIKNVVENFAYQPFSYCCGIKVIGNLTVSGDDNATLTTTGGVADVSDGIYAEGNVVITGGTVTATGSGSNWDEGEYCSWSRGICSANVTVTGGKVFATGGEAEYSCGISAEDNVTITNGIVTTTSSKASADSYSIIADGITVEGGMVTAISGVAMNSYGICVTSNVSVTGGTLTTTSGDADIKSTGISAYDVTITGGQVTASGGNTTGTGESYGIYVISNVTLNGGTVTAIGGESGKCSYGIYAEYNVYTASNVTVNGGTVNATGSKAGNYSYGIWAQIVAVENGTVIASSGAAVYSYGIYARDYVTIKDGSVTTTGGTSKYSYGIAAEGNVMVSSGELTATGGTATAQSYGIWGLDTTVEGSTVIATGGATTDNYSESYGIYARGDGINLRGNITIKSGTVTAIGDDYGIYAVGDVIVNGGTVTSEGALRYGEDFVVASTLRVTAADSVMNPLGPYAPEQHTTYKYIRIEDANECTTEGSHITEKDENKATCQNKAVCDLCGASYGEIAPENHTIENHVCTLCGAMEIVVNFDAGDYEWKTGDTLYFCRVSRDNQWEQYCFTAAVAEDGAVTWTPDKTLYWDGMGEHKLIISYPANMGLGWDNFAIPTDQSDAEKLKAADCMNARWVGIPTTDVINFELKHRMAKITVEYVLASQFDGSEDVTAQIHSNAKYCIFSDADGLPMNTSVGQYDAWVTPHMYEEDVFGHYLTAYVAPGKYDVGSTFIKFYVDGGEIPWIMREEMTFEEGGEYNFEVKVGKNKLLVSTDKVTITDYPGGWNSDAEVGSIGRPDEGKIQWADGDQVFVTLTSDHYGVQTAAFTFDGEDWECEGTLRYLEGEVPVVTAIYAPCYAYDDDDKVIVPADGMQPGMAEYIVADCEMSNAYSINVNFAEDRTYSRLRIVAQPNQTLTVTATDFTPVGTDEAGTHTYTLTADDKGNAYLYGIFAEGANLTVNGATSMLHYTNGTEHNKSYAVCASHTAAEGAEATCLGYRCEQCGLYFGNKDESKHVTEMESNKATCQKQAVCDLCGTSYGEVDTNNHGADCTVTYAPTEDGKHTGTYSQCGAETAAEACSGGVEHTCMGFKCAKCGSWYGVGNADNHVKIGQCDCGFIAYPVWITGVQFTDSNLNYPGFRGVSYDPENNILHVSKKFGDPDADNIALKVIGDITIQLDGDCSIYGNIDVTGNLTINGEHALTVHGYAYGIRAENVTLGDSVHVISNATQAVDAESVSGSGYSRTTADGAFGGFAVPGSVGYYEVIGSNLTDDINEDHTVHTRSCGCGCGTPLQEGGRNSEATCQSKAVCSLCGEYGEKDLTNHGADCTVTYTPTEGGKHTATYSKCGTKTEEVRCDDLAFAVSEDGSSCTVTCRLCRAVLETVTILAPACKIYGDGASCEITILLDGEAVPNPANITYYKMNDNQWEVLAAAPTGAGTYRAEGVNVGGESDPSDDFIIYVEYTIAKADPTYTVPENLTAIYGDTLVNVNLPTGFAWTDATQSVGNAGTNIFTATYDLQNSNYNVIENIAVPVQVAPKAVASADITVSGTHTYTGSDIKPAVTVAGYEANTDYEVAYSNNVNVGTATVTVSFKGNYSGTVTETFQIGKAMLTITAENKSMTTSQALPALTYTITGFVGGEDASVLTAQPVAATGADGKTVGTYDITVSGAAADNYGFTYVNGTLSVVDHQHAWTYTADGDTITATCGNAATCPDAEQTITVSAQGKTYDGTAVTATLTGSIDGVATPAITYFKNGEELNESVIHAGTYTARITVGGVTASAEFTIDPATPVLVWDDHTTTYTGEPADLPALSITLVNGETFSGSITCTYDDGKPGLPTDAGTYAVTASVAATGNYTAASTTIQLTITQAAAPDIQWPTAAALTYGQKLSESALTSQDTNGTFAWKDGSIVPTVNNSGYTVVYTPKDAKNYDYANVTLEKTIAVTVGKAAPDVTVPTGLTAVYGQTLENVALPNGWAWVNSNASVGDAGTHTFEAVFTPEDTANYNTRTEDLTVNVDKKPVAEPTVGSIHTYTGTEQTVTLNGVESYMTVASGNKGTNAGNYEVEVTLDKNHKWAEGSNGKIQWTIGKAEFGDVYVSQSGMLTYNGTAQTPNVNTDADSVGDQTATFAYRLTENESYGEMPAFTDAGTYTVYYKASAPNHKDATGSFTVTVDKAKAEIAVNTDPITVVYGEAVVLPTATTNFGTVACDKTASDLVNAGTYTVTYSVAGSDNYNGDTKTITVTVNAKVVNQPVIEGIEAVYILSENAITPVPTAVKDGATVIDPSEYTLAYENNTAAGTATVKIVDKDGGNYTVNGSMTFQIVEHEHTWTYTTDSNASKIIATCSNADGHCPNTNGGSVSIQDPDELTYDGSTKDAELVYESWQPEEVTITYNNVDRVNVTGKEIVASIGVVGAGIQSVYTIVAAALPNATLSADSGTYTGQAHTVTVVLDTLVKDTDYTVSIPEDMTNVGTKTITVNGKGNYEGTQNLTYTITKRSDVAAPAPGVGYTIDYAKETITIAEGFEVIDSDGKAVVSGSAADYFGKMLSVRYAETQNTEASAYTSFTLAERPAVPNVTIHNETIKGKADGKITGLDTTMEYSTDGGKHWVSVETTDAGEKNLTVGTTIAVRMKATQTAPCSESKTGTVAAGAAITVTYAENGQAADGMPAQVSDLSYGNKLTKPADPTAKNTDFAFRGWYKDAACTTAWDFAKDTVTEETVTLYAKWEQVYFSVTAEIKDHNNVEYHGEVEVKLMRGDSTIDSVTGTAGSFQFSRHVEGGMYNLVAIYTDSTGEHTKTELITVDHDETFVLKLPAPGVNSHLTVSDNAQTPDVMVGELDAEAESIKQQTGATKVEIEMTVTGKTENQVPATVVNAVEEATDNAAVEYLDITVTKQIDDGAKTEMSETTNLMEIVVPYNTNGKTNLRVFRHHDGQLQEFAQGRDADQTFYYASGYIHIFTKYFSNYMISYEVSHTVTFDANGGTVGTNSLTTQTNGTLSTLPTPTREHYVFKGWYTAKSGGTKVTTDTVFNGDATIYAQWGGYAITVADAKNGTVTVDRSEAPGATEITITVTPKTGYKMSALTVKDAAGKSYVISTDNNGKYYFTMPDADVTVKVTFSKTSTSTADTTNPKTGDSFLLVPFSSMAAASLLALAVLMLNKKKLYQK